MATTIELYDVGDIATVSASFTNDLGAAADPTVVTATGYAPDGTVANYTVTAGQIVKDSTGHYHIDIPVALAGDYSGAFKGVGVVTATAPWNFTGRAPQRLTADALTTLAAARAHILRDPANGSQDDVFVLYINAYSKAISNYCRREFHPTTAATRDFIYDGSGILNLAPYELRTATAIKLYSDQPSLQQQTLDGTQYRLEPIGRTPEGTYLALNTILPGRLPSQYAFEWQVTITGDWGMAAVPADVQLATLIAVDDAYRNPGGFQTVQVGAGTSFEEPVGAGGSLPAASLRLLIPYRRRPRLSTLSFTRPPHNVLFPDQVP